jgi:tetratricopeptide (TPR) repeat protein
MLDAWEARLRLCVLDGDLTLLLQLGIEALSAAASIGNRAAEARLASTVGKHLALRRMKQEPAMQYVQYAFDCASQLDDPALLAMVLCRMAFVQRRYGQYRAARCTAQGALLLIEQHAEQIAELRADALMELACAERGLANWASAWSALQTVVQLYKEHCNYWGLGEAYLEFVGIACCIGQPEAARRVLDSLADVTHTLGVASEADIGMYLMFAKVVSVQYVVQIGDYETAQQLLDALWQWAATLDQGPEFTLHILQGLLHLAQGQFAAAATELGHALDMWDGERPEPELLLWHAIAAYRTGSIKDAARSLERAVLVLQRCDIAHCDVLLHFTRYLVLGEPAALVAAHTEMMRQAAQFTDPHMYDGFLHKIPLHCEIEAHRLALAELGKKVVVRLTGSSVPLGKSLTNADRIDVVWTVDAGEPDAEVLRSRGKISLRHYRIKRLLIEARAQGAAPTDADLARVLGVTERTIFSDMRAINMREQTSHTRRRQRLLLK